MYFAYSYSQLSMDLKVQLESKSLLLLVLGACAVEYTTIEQLTVREYSALTVVHVQCACTCTCSGKINFVTVVCISRITCIKF